ncbi:acyltransferase [Shewanella sp.]|uniref:acyltransferase n=1 Tax=Shewanella sp. TaxID=50422 RepID=UPI004047DC55
MNKFFWMLRAIVYKIFMKQFGLLSYIGSPCYVSGLPFWQFGYKVRIYPQARIESLGGVIRIGDDVSIGQNLHLISMSSVYIGSKTTVSANVFISDVDHDYKIIDVHIMDQALIAKETFIGENCFIGYGCVILPGTFLGKQCIVGANSVVRGTFPDHCVIAGSPAKIIKRYDFINNIWKKTDSSGNFI